MNFKQAIIWLSAASSLSGCVSIPIQEEVIKVNMLVSNRLYHVSPEYIKSLDADTKLCKLVSEQRKIRSEITNSVITAPWNIELSREYVITTDTLKSQYFVIFDDNIITDQQNSWTEIKPDKFKAILYSPNCDGTSSSIVPPKKKNEDWIEI